MATASKRRTRQAITVGRDRLIARLRPICAGDTTTMAEWSIPQGADVTDGDVRTWRACVNGRKLLECVTALRSKSVTIERDDDGIEVSGGFASYRLAIVDAELFPTAAWGEHVLTERCRMESDGLRAAIERVAWCCRDASDNVVMGGVWFLFHGARLTLAASNGGRLSSMECGLKTVVTGADDLGRRMNLPVEMARKLVDLLPESGDVTIGADPGAMEFTLCHDGESFRARSGLIGSVRFPDFLEIIPDGNPALAVTVSGARLGALCRLMRLFLDEDRIGVALKIHADPGEEIAEMSAEIIGSNGHGCQTIECRVTHEFPREGMQIVVNSDDVIGLCQLADDVTIYPATKAGERFRLDARHGWVLCFSQVEVTSIKK